MTERSLAEAERVASQVVNPAEALDQEARAYVSRIIRRLVHEARHRAAAPTAPAQQPGPVATEPGAVDYSQALAAFTEYVEANYPANTIIGDPAWHAPRLFRIAKRHIIAALAAQPQTAEPAAGGPPSGYEATTPWYTRYVSPERYAKFSPAVQRWYRPYWVPPAAADPAAVDAKLQVLLDMHGQWNNGMHVARLAREIRAIMAGAVKTESAS